MSPAVHEGSADAQRCAEVAKTYYDSPDSETFYFNTWGGQDIHVGLYNGAQDSIKDASRRTVERMAEYLPEGFGSAHRVVDLGAGYGGPARYLAKRFGCSVECLNVSERQNVRNMQVNEAEGLAGLVSVTPGSFEALPASWTSTFDVVWSEDAFVHSHDHEAVFRETDRVMKPGAVLIFTDPMCTAADVPKDAMQPILDRLQLSHMASPEQYKRIAGDLGWELVAFEDLSGMLKEHYSRVRKELLRVHADGTEFSPEYVCRMAAGLELWVENASRGILKWGIFVFRKPSAA